MSRLAFVHVMLCIKQLVIQCRMRRSGENGLLDDCTWVQQAVLEDAEQLLNKQGSTLAE